MIVNIALVVVGLVLLVFAGDALVRGAVNLALRLGIPALIVGLTVVAFGTSAPELLVSVQAVLKDAPAIALGNVVGSNIANIFLVLGVPAMISVIHGDAVDTRRSYVMMLVASVLFMALAYLGPMVWWHALILLAGLGLMLFDSYRSTRTHQADVGAGLIEAEVLEGVEPGMSGAKIAMFLLIGMIGLPLGADLLIDNAIEIARTIGMSEAVIGLTLVAIGTSLPELATSVMAAIRRNADVALGNVIGSNMFNLLGIIGVAGLVGPLPVPEEMLRVDLWVMLGAAVIIAPVMIFRWNITRMGGALMVAIYCAYLLWLVI